MIEKNYNGNIFLLPDKQDACIVTTNGIVKNNGLAVMGAGIAKYCRDTFHGVDRILADNLKRGNHCYYLGNWYVPSSTQTMFTLYSFPTKHDWRERSDIGLIRQSCREIMELVDKDIIHKVYMPCPGCSNGGLDYYGIVRPVLKDKLDDRFVVCIPDSIKPF